MNGAQGVVQALRDAGVGTWFANPGTSEMHLVQALDAAAGVRAVLCLFEGICTGAADGFGRMAGRPAATLLHLGAGFGNGIANLHNARRAATPVINVVGDHAIHHVPFDAPLTSDIEALARPVSAWVRTARSSEGAGADALDALRAALRPRPDPHGAVSTLILPADCAWGPGRAAPAEAMEMARPRVPSDAIDDAARALDAQSLLLIDGAGLGEQGVIDAGRIAAKTGCRLFAPGAPARVESGPSLAPVQRMPYFPEHVLEVLKPVRRLVLLGARRPASFFAYPHLPSDLVPEHCAVLRVARRHEDVAGALADLALALDAPPREPAAPRKPPAPASGERLSARGIAALLARRAPENSIVAVDSGGGGAAYPVLQHAVRHTWLNLTGGAIGQGGPVAVGAALACPQRQTFALLGDGGAMYTNQFLWTAARESLDLIAVIFSNRRYGILETEYRRLGVRAIGACADSLFDLSQPRIDWVALAAAQGVEGARTHTCGEFDAALARALAAGGPHLIEADLAA